MNTLKLEAIKNSGKSMEIIVLFAIMLAIIIIDVFVNLKKKKSSCNGLLTVKPDTHMDFCNMPYKDSFFHVVIFDLAHLACPYFNQLRAGAFYLALEREIFVQRTDTPSVVVAG